MILARSPNGRAQGLYQELVCTLPIKALGVSRGIGSKESRRSRSGLI